MINVHMLEDFEAETLAELRAQLDVRVHLTTGELLSDAEILIGGRPTREQLLACAQVHALIVPWAGVPDNTQALLREFPHIAVHNLHHNAAATAEYAVALLMAAAKFIVPVDRHLRLNDWTPRYAPSRSIGLAGKTALILGYGQIGQRVGRGCAALGMTVIATRRNRLEKDEVAAVYATSELSTLLPQTDVIIITAPLTPETKGLIGEKELALLPRGSILVNVGRGLIVDEAALFSALKSGHLGAAGLDVWYQYPKDEASRVNTPPSQFPFHELDNVVLSPHRGGDEVGIDTQRMTELAELLNAAARGETMLNRVDVEAGY
ncbi:MAG: hydroxyacid dehydrogenase [Chloroflexi bacterium]|nr:hydroxyacid dehydrogenase [Chloroflexota bacterium]